MARAVTFSWWTVWPSTPTAKNSDFALCKTCSPREGCAEVFCRPKTARGVTADKLTAPVVAACRRWDGGLDLDLLRQRLGLVKMVRDALAVGVADSVFARFPAFKGAGEVWVSRDDARLMVGLGVVFVD